MRVLPAVVCLALVAVAGAAPQKPVVEIPTEVTRGWAILADGRIKPLGTAAREIVRSLTGRSRLDGLDALDILWGYQLDAAAFRARAYLRLDSKELKARLGLPADKRRVSFDALMGDTTFQQLVEEATRRRRDGTEPTRLDRDALDAYHQLETVAALIRGDALTIVPVTAKDGGWSTPAEMRGAPEPERRAVHEGFAKLAAAYRARDAAAFVDAAKGLTLRLRAVAPRLYPEASRIDRELFYNDFNAFGKAWVLYLLGFLVLLFGGFARLARLGGFALLACGFATHTVGLVLRWVIAGRAPVSDMYESLVFMGWGVIAIGLVLEAVYRKRVFALAAGLMGFLSVMFAEHLPLDAAINPLVPVLAHTSWLSIHVMTIMLSYSAFALTATLGHGILAVQVFRPGKTDLLHGLSLLLYKALQVGLLFLAAGIAFGAIWANESWGRYWGWDPKETWSLITFFVYLAIVHARFAGWLHDFGLALSSIAGFVSVLMTYYGVNFVLGTGLHSYGFASGGLVWAVAFLAAEALVLAGATLRYRRAVSGAA